MIKHISFIGLISLFFGFSSCETEFSLNGDYEITPIVFGLLDQNDTTHYIKITKAFLGDGNNLVYAKNPDSSYFKQVDAKIIEYDEFGELTGREWSLKDTLIKDKSTDGLFYAPEQKVYYFKEATLIPENEYEIIADINEGAFKIKARTGLVSGFNITTNLSTKKASFANNKVDELDDYVSFKFAYKQAKNGKNYEIGYTVFWTEYYLDETSSSFSAHKNETKDQQKNPNSPSSFTVNIDGLDFYQWIENIIPDDETVERRTFDSINFNINVAHHNLSQYMDVAKPVTGLAQVQPVFTNIEGGYGIFSSRLLFTLGGFKLTASSAKELAKGQFTYTKLFCSSDPIHNDETYFCPE